MNTRARIAIKNLSYTLISNFLSLFISIILILIIPKLIGIKEYGYWQLYLFYCSYIGFMQFGWNDGIYLRYGGKKYNELDKKLFFSQFWMLAIFQIVLAGIIILFSFFFTKDMDKQFILYMVSLSLITLGVRAMPLFILQGTNKIKGYAKINILDRMLFFLIIMVFLALKVNEFKFLVLSDLIAKFISLLYAMYYCRDIVFCKLSSFYFNYREAFSNINAGIKLMFANIASILIIGVVRLGIEHTWDVSTFGKISLILSISNLMMIFINAVGIVMFPILRRSNRSDLPNIYINLRDFLMLFLLGSLFLYYPLKGGLSVWLPNYSDSFIYMSLVFPICIFEGKMSLLINTYLKTLRKEKMMLLINLIPLSLSLIITLMNILVFKNLNFAISSIVFLLALRCVLAELYLSRILAISFKKDILFELFVTLTFILTEWYLTSLIAALSYLLIYIIYLTIKRKDIVRMLKYMRILMKT